jgi:hypothetical protein
MGNEIGVSAQKSGSQIFFNKTQEYIYDPKGWKYVASMERFMEERQLLS